MSEKIEKQQEVTETEQLGETEDTELETIELTTEQLETLLGVDDESPINIGELLETEMVTTRTLYINDEISDESIGHIIMLIHKFNRDDYGLKQEEKIPVLLHISTQGGALYSAFNLIGAIEASQTPIIGIVEGGICMSAGIPIFLACHHRVISRHSTFLYHDLRTSGGSDGHITLAEMKNTYAHYDNLQNRIDEYIAERTTIPIKKLKKKRKKNVDWYLSLKDLEKYGFYNELL